MDKRAIAAILGLAIGSLAGYGAARAVSSTRQAALETTLHGAAAENQRLKQQLDLQAKALIKAESESARLTEDTKSLRAELDAKNALLDQSNAAAQELATETSTDRALPQSPQQTSSAGQKADSLSGLRARLPNRVDTAARLREGLQKYMDSEISKTQDPGAAQRLSVLSDAMQQQMDLVQQLRDAKTDAERETARQNLSDLRSSMRDLVREQQDATLRQLASQYGVTTPDQQDQFIQSVRSVQNSPFFRMGGGFTPAVPAGGP